MMHYYLCRFYIYKDGNKKARPHIDGRYVQAGNHDEAYKKAQLICKSGLLTNGGQHLAVCRKKDIDNLLIVDARKAIKRNPGLLIDAPPEVQGKGEGSPE